MLTVDVTVNVALLRPAAMSSTYNHHTLAAYAVDGDLQTLACTYMISTEPWLSVDLGTQLDVGRVCVTNDDNPAFGQLSLSGLIFTELILIRVPHAQEACSLHETCTRNVHGI